VARDEDEDSRRELRLGGAWLRGVGGVAQNTRKCGRHNLVSPARELVGDLGCSTGYQSWLAWCERRECTSCGKLGYKGGGLDRRRFGVRSSGIPRPAKVRSSRREVPLLLRFVPKVGGRLWSLHRAIVYSHML
jgi:hypothetical protein